MTAQDLHRIRRRLAISLFGPAIRNLREFEADFRFERRFLLVSFRLSALLPMRGRYFAAGVAMLGLGLLPVPLSPAECQQPRRSSTEEDE